MKKNGSPPLPALPEVLAPERFLAGYDPAIIDPIITPLYLQAQGAVNVLSAAIPVLQAGIERLSRRIEAEQKAEREPTSDEKDTRRSIQGLQSDVDTVSRAAERAAKVLGAVAKAADDLSRLRQFLAGGPDRRIESLEGMTDQDLMALVMGFVGERCPKCRGKLEKGEV